MGRHRSPDADDAGWRPVPPDRERAGKLIDLIQLIDSHAHLLSLRAPDTPDSALREAADAGVTRVINIGDDPTDNEPGIQLAERIPALRTTVGWHPHFADHPLEAKELRALRTLAAHPRVVAVGEIGLDYAFTEYHRVPAKAQARAFRQMLGLSQELGKPVVLHTRDAFADLLAILDEFPGIGGVFHCFSGNAAIASECLARGFAISFAATVTYPGAHDVKGAAGLVPLDRMLVETDAPFLPPQSRRGQPNAPRYLPETVQGIATLRGDSIESVAAATRRNAIQLFGLDG
ncbi:MAG: TatD family deoxyribonuclease [Chloroflexi bacterium]|nr:MAG: TatD family deoxyribonuclease [Chloroflexota bacterium]